MLKGAMCVECIHIGCILILNVKNVSFENIFEIANEPDAERTGK